MTTSRSDKINKVFGEKTPYIREFDGKKYRLYDEFRNEERAQGCARGLRTSGYLARVVPRLIDTWKRKNGRFVHDVFIGRK